MGVTEARTVLYCKGPVNIQPLSTQRLLNTQSPYNQHPLNIIGVRSTVLRICTRDAGEYASTVSWPKGAFQVVASEFSC